VRRQHAGKLELASVNAAGTISEKLIIASNETAHA